MSGHTGSGEGATVVCLHGLGRAPSDWDAVRPGLEGFGSVRGPTLSRARVDALAAASAHARDDHHLPLDFALAAAARRPDWALHVFQGGGHHVHVDRPGEWLAPVTTWLRRNTQAGPGV